MKKLLLGLLISVGLWSCSDQEPNPYTGQSLDFELFKSSDFNYSGNLVVQELVTGDLEFTIKLDGATSTSSISYPAHLHFGSYDQADAPIAQLLTPVSGSDLKSVSVVNTLSDGSKVSFDQMKNFDGHVKIHLANEGPDYQVILVAGNVGANFNPELGFDPSKITVCGKSF
ncbi:hypothetical protein [Algoriphagus sp.]|uniref:hypothetical protein n=1 Tax=Algoriphagus sp. TaxID=1872435 RepID=UPI0039195D5C